MQRSVRVFLQLASIGLAILFALALPVLWGRDIATAQSTAPVQSSKLSFDGDIAPVFNKYCTGCHSGSAPPNGVDLTTYSGVSQVALSGLLYGVVAHLPGFDPMPKGSGILSDCEIAQIREWVDAGALDN